MAVSYENLPNAASTQPLSADLANVPELKDPGPLDATLPPTPIRELLAASGATVFVLANDANLVATIRRAAEQHPLYVVETWAEILQAVESERCGIALLDAAVLGGRVAECVDRLAAYSDRLVTLVAAERGGAHQYIGLLSDGKIHRLLIKPTAVGAARLLIESATARRLQLREESANDDTHAGTPAPSSKVEKKKAGVMAGVLGAAALIGLAILGSQLGWLDRSPTAESAATPAAASPPAESAPPLDTRLAEIRAKAELALQEGRLAEPLGDNALEHYRAILALAPADQAARDGVTSVVETLFKRAEEALLAEQLDVTAAALDHVRRVDPSSSRLAFLDAQLARALAALAVAPPPVTAGPQTAASPTELESTLSLAAARLRRGQLVSPPGDNARAYLDRAVRLAPNDARVAALRADVAAALIAAARLLADADVTAATNLAAEARGLGVQSAELAALERELGAARANDEHQQRLALLETARARTQNGALFAPAGDSALDHLSGLQTVAPDLAGLAEAWQAFQEAAVLSIRGAIERAEWAAAETQLAGLARAPGGAAAGAPLADELAAGRLQETYLTTAAPTGALTLLSSAPAVYPADALQRGVQGWVDLEFIVDREGVPRNLFVMRASPAGRFDAAALEAVRQYRYAPFEQDGRVYERLARVRVRFQLQQRQ
jgi:TonB family protein